MKELLSGQGALALGAAPQSAELNAGGQASHGENAGLPFLGSGSAVGAAALEGLRAAGNVEENPEEMGGGEPADPVEGYFKNVRLDKIQEFISDQQGKGLSDTAPVRLSDGTAILFGEYKNIATAVQAGLGKGKSVEQLVREARQQVLPLQGEGYQTKIEKILNLSSDYQRNGGESIAANFLTELKKTLASRYRNDLEKQSATLRNLYNQLRKDDALGFSPDIELIPPGADISTLLSLLKSMLQGNGGQ